MTILYLTKYELTYNGIAQKYNEYLAVFDCLLNRQCGSLNVPAMYLLDLWFNILNRTEHLLKLPLWLNETPRLRVYTQTLWINKSLLIINRIFFFKTNLNGQLFWQFRSISGVTTTLRGHVRPWPDNISASYD